MPERVCEEPTRIRGLVAPRSDAPAQLAPGEALEITIASATGLTPPPGLQEPRAHRALYVGLCSEGVGLGASGHVCTPLTVDDVRPCAAHTLVYRVRAHLEAWLARGEYSLRVRFPGGEVEAPRSVRIGATGGTRAHVGARGVQGLPVGAAVSPLPAADGDFAAGFVLQWPYVGAPSPDAPSAARAELSLALRVEPAETMGKVHVRVLGAPRDAHVFVRSGLGASAVGPDVWLPAGVLGPLAISALVVASDGRAALLHAEAAVLPRLAFGCAVAHGGVSGRGLMAALGLLALAVSATLRRFVRKGRAATPPILCPVAGNTP